MSFASWNVRGLAGIGKLSMIKAFRKKFNLHMLGLVETKKEMVNRFDVMQLWGNDGAGWEFVEAEGASGGLLLMWDTTVFKLSNCYKGGRWLCVDGVMLKNNFRCAFCLVYGEHDRESKLVMWEELSFLSGLCQVPLCFLGDFNEIVQVEERRGSMSLPRSAVEFKSWIHDMELVDLALSDRQFTWFRGQSCSRLDRVLVSLEWLEEFPETRLRGGPRGLSDHCPIIMNVTRLGWGPRPFRSLDAWFTHEGFLRMVKEEWRCLGEMQLMDKLKALARPLGRWHRENFGNLDRRINNFEEEIRKVDDLVSIGVHDGTMEARRKALVSACKVWYVRKEMHWKQMSRSRHAKEMDKNTRYFHNLASARRRSNRIDALRIHGRLVRNPARIKIAIRDFYKELYHQEKSPNIGFREGLVRRINGDEATELEQIPSAEEVKSAVWYCVGQKLGGNSRMQCWGSSIQQYYRRGQMSRGWRWHQNLLELQK
ncbi:uncharacterized protein LOC107627082 [Arachis ipaensis]|uniref:uncharacterized protein LOC107627082 n=1 Tax=Arachis ipaensis TaxID=130454 RepID=UPI0007AFCB60|nr:uncharacterized protein LOC107627082 [Arachis ipaensis]